MKDKEVKEFVRIIMALPFLPINRLKVVDPETNEVQSPILEELKDFTIKQSSPFYQDFQKFRDGLLDYMHQTWIIGFDVSMWCHYNESSDLTNNPNEVRLIIKATRH